MGMGNGVISFARSDGLPGLFPHESFEMSRNDLLEAGATRHGVYQKCLTEVPV